LGARPEVSKEEGIDDTIAWENMRRSWRNRTLSLMGWNCLFRHDPDDLAEALDWRRCPNVRNIVLLRPINSMIEFKQIIGRGTRLFGGKDFFIIYDFVQAHEKFNDPEWDGPPLILKNCFYMGHLEWVGETYHGTHPLFIDPKIFAKVQAVLSLHNRPKNSKREVAFRGLMNCACLPATCKKKYVYYRRTTHRGKCDLPRFREEDIADRLGEPLKGLQVPPEIVSQIVATLREDQKKAQGKVSAEQTRRRKVGRDD
jgi:hypothetical protein